MVQQKKKKVPDTIKVFKGDTSAGKGIKTMPLFNTTWAILEDSLSELLEYKVDSIESFFDVSDIPLAAMPIVNGEATIELRGPLFKHSNIFTALGMGTSLEEATRLFLEAQNDTSVKAIKHIFDTPGGQVSGTRQYAQLINAYKGVKPNKAVVESVCASAGIWIASQCDTIEATDKTDQVGSIGVVVHIEKNQDGNAVIITNDSSPFKEGDPSTPEGVADYKRIINGLATIFEEDVAEGRSTTVADVQQNYGKGSILLAQDALAVGMIDKIEQTYGGNNMITLEQVKAEAPGIIDEVLAEAEVPELQVKVSELTTELAAAEAKIPAMEAQIVDLTAKVPAPKVEILPEVKVLTDRIQALEVEKVEARLSFLDAETKPLMIEAYNRLDAVNFGKLEASFKALTDKINVLGASKGDGTVSPDQTLDDKIEAKMKKLQTSDPSLGATDAYIEAAKLAA